MITVELEMEEDGKFKEVVGIYFDDDGLEELVGRLSLLRGDSTDHLHLMSESWGLSDLAEEKQGVIQPLYIISN